MVNAAAWVQHYLRCTDLYIDGITVNSYANKNNDGLDLESCERVFVTRCNISSEDDAIVLKALTPAPCRDEVIADCIISGLKSAIKTGTESAGNFENISVTNCSIYGTRGISLLAVDGGSIDGITISNISMRNTYAVLVMRLDDRLRPYNVPPEQRPATAGTLRNVSVSNVQATGVTESNDFIAGIAGHNIEQITLSNIHIEYAGGGKREDTSREIPELTGEYPKARMFGVLPAYGFFIRHASGIVLDNISLSWQKPDGRSVLFLSDVQNVKITGLTADSRSDAAPFIRLRKAEDVLIRDTSPSGTTGTFLKAEECRNVILTGNALSKAKHKTDLTQTENIIEKNNF